MDYMTISQVSRRYDVSTRTLRYYEELGLLQSMRQEEYKYRVYDEEAVTALRRILLLRSLRIPLRRIAEILHDEEGRCTVQALEETLAQLDAERRAIDVVRRALIVLLRRLHSRVTLTEALAQLPMLPALPEINFKGETTMDELNRANQTLSRFDNTRIIYIPPATVASSHSLDPEPENEAGEAINRFILSERLFERKPDYRLFGFNNPNPTPESDFHGYEYWVTIPDDMDVPAPLVKKQMPGGLYAAHCIKMDDFEEWWYFWNWVNHNDVCCYEEREPLGMGGSLEEHLNAPGTFQNVTPENARDVHFAQLDLLIPIKMK
ncbi:MAG: effector binding domain-containing protein [Clostridiaceae bacterium]|nr:effector binding domain-containing protein [Clostridiaceae bacterium]